MVLSMVGEGEGDGPVEGSWATDPTCAAQLTSPGSAPDLVVLIIYSLLLYLLLLLILSLSLFIIDYYICNY